MEYKVSVIMPVYNAAKYVEKSILSLLAQTYSNLEIIVVDDGSKDNSFSLCLALAEKDARLRVFSQRNSGVSATRNRGLVLATGELVVFVDSDDWLPESGIASLVQLYEKYHCSLICGSYCLAKTRNRILKKKYRDQYLDLTDLDSEVEDVVLSLHCAPWAKIYETEIIRKNNICFPEDIPYAEDGIFLYCYLKHVQSLYISSQGVYFYNYTDSNSAARKYHKEYGQYLRELLNAQIDYFVDLQHKQRLIQRLEKEYFMRSLRHYILHEKNTVNLLESIRLTASLFPTMREDDFWGQYIHSNQWSRIVLLWKFYNLKDFCIEMLKIKFL